MRFFAPEPAFACKRALSLCHALAQRLAMPRIRAAYKAPAVFLALWSRSLRSALGAQPWAICERRIAFAAELRAMLVHLSKYDAQGDFH